MMEKDALEWMKTNLQDIADICTELRRLNEFYGLERVLHKANAMIGYLDVALHLQSIKKEEK